MGNREDQVRAIAGTIGQLLRHLRDFGYSDNVILEGLAKASFEPPPRPTRAEIESFLAQARLIHMEPQGSA